MKMQIKKDKQNIVAVCITITLFGALTNYTIFYKSGSKRSFVSPSAAFRSRFDWFHIRFDSDDFPLLFDRGSRTVLLTPYNNSKIPNSVFTYFPLLRRFIHDDIII